MEHVYTVLSPWAERKVAASQPLNPRLESLARAKIGILGLFKEYHRPLAEAIADMFSARFPEASVSTFIYTIDQTDPEEDPANWPAILEFIRSVDAIVEVGADAGSCSMFAGYIAGTCEKYGKPTGLFVTEGFEQLARCGCGAKGFSLLRQVSQPLGMAHIPVGVSAADHIRRVYVPVFQSHLDEMIDALTRPLSAEEQAPVDLAGTLDKDTFTGTLEQLSDLFYRYGWTNGTPIVPPTREAVDNMLRGTDLPADHVLGYLPPMMGKCTVEKVAVNAVMAGCLPTHMPILLAIVKMLTDPATLKPFHTCANGYPKLNLECMTASTLGFAPLFVLSGSITKQIGMHIDGNYMSPYDRVKSTVPKAYSYLIMNIAGVRGHMEDGSNTGHESRMGVMVAENIDESPWPSLAADFGYGDGENAVALYFYVNRDSYKCHNTESALEGAILERVYGMDSGMGIAFPPNVAKKMAADGMTKQRIMDYIVKYARRPYNEFPRGMKGNNHEPKNTVLPFAGSYPVEKYISTDHFLVWVGGNMGTNMPKAMTFLTDGGHGTPSCAKIDLPGNWNDLISEYGPASTQDPVRYY